MKIFHLEKVLLKKNSKDKRCCLGCQFLSVAGQEIVQLRGQHL